jgi:NhaP-type Na+/H+ or K+/H+ antiporter
MGMMVFMFVMKSLVEKYKPSIGHETSATILFGVIFSLVLFYSTPNAKDFAYTWTVKPSLFFDFFVPPIVFNSGFNMKKKTFFKNLGNISISGLLVTLICFAIYAVGCYISTQVFHFEYTDYSKEPNITG